MYAAGPIPLLRLCALPLAPKSCVIKPFPSFQNKPCIYGNFLRSLDITDIEALVLRGRDAGTSLIPARDER